MKRVGSKKKIILPIILVLTGTLLTTSLVVYNNLTSVSADATFDGINKIIDEKTKDGSTDDTFNIVEVVPDKSMASFGYLIDGQEPDLGLEELSAICKNDGTGSQARKEYMDSVKKRLSSIIDDSEAANTKPLYADGDYEESYINPDENADGSVKEDSEWKKIDLAGDEVIPAGTVGYTMKDVGDGKGEYDLDYEYELAVKDGQPIGEYNQNVDYFVYIDGDTDQTLDKKRGYYTPCFKEAEITNGVTNEQYFSEKNENGNIKNKAYKVIKATKIGEEDNPWWCGGKGNVTNESGKNPDTIVYYSSSGSDTYHYLGRAGDFYNGSPNWNSIPNSDNNIYYKLELEYVPLENIKNDDTYYVVDNVIFSAERLGKYGAVLDSKQPYIKSSESSLFKQMGYFNQNKDKPVYRYIGKNGGVYNLVKSSNEKLDNKVSISSLYVKTGFANRDWFRKYVFNGNNKIKFNVETVTPSELNNMSIPSINLLYISCIGLDGEKGKNFSQSDDITKENADKILKLVRDNSTRIPVIVDSGITNKNLNVYGPISIISKLAEILSSSNNIATQNIDGLQFQKINNVDQVIQYDYNTYKNGIVCNNVYDMPPTGENDVPYILKNFTEVFGNMTGSQSDRVFKDAANTIGCGEIAEYINQQNQTRKNNNEELIKKQINRAVILSYIIAYSHKEEIQTKQLESLNVLAIQPRAITQGENGNWEETIRTKVMAMLGNNSPKKEKIYITRYSMSEFIGKIEDLSKYDMIYMGLSTTNYNLNWNTTTVYNDTNMNGLIYSNVGDVIPVSPYTNGFSGMLDSDYNNSNRSNGLNTSMTKYDQNGYATAVNTYRTAGNDITEDKIKALKNYLNAGYPIVFDNGFFDYNSESKVNENVIDNSSNMFSFLKDIYNLDNIVELDKAGNAYNLYNLLNNGKPKLTVTAPKNVKEQAYSESSDGKLSIEFTVGNTLKTDASDAIDVDFYIDSNMDGKFSETNEKLATDEYSLYNGGSLVQPMANNDSTKYVINEGENKYKLVYELPVGYVGVINWKMVVRDESNVYRYDYDSGYVHMAAGEGQQIKVKILQICSPNEPDVSRLEVVIKKDINAWVKDHGNEKAPWDNSYVDEKVEELKKNGDYDLQFTTYASNDNTLIDICKNKKLSDYDMIVLGFADNYQIDNSNKVLDAVKNYIEEGKPVIVTKNVFTSCNYFNGNSSQSRGYDVNKILRDIVGMDRYGVLSSKSLIKGQELDSSSTSSAADYSEAEAYATANSTDIPYEPRSGKSKIVRQSQGYTYINLERNRSSENVLYRTYRDDNQSWQEKPGIYNDTNELNRGQISVYPNNLTKLNGKLRTADVDSAPYQINMKHDDDGDGETDLVVWYTLYSWGNPSLEMGHSESDARNNYYLYTMRNVTYCGIGSTGANGYTATDETDLFINTIVTTYGTALRAPKLLLKEGYDKNSADVNVIYSSLDDVIDKQNNTSGSTETTDANLDKTIDVYFTVNDNNRIVNQVKDKTVEHVDFFIAGTSGDYTDMFVDGKNTVYLKKVDWDTYALQANGEEYDDPTINPMKFHIYSNGVTYKVKVPMSVLQNGQNSVKVYAVAYSDLVKLKNKGAGTDDDNIVHVTTPKVFRTFNVQRIGLADLD